MSARCGVWTWDGVTFQFSDAGHHCLPAALDFLSEATSEQDRGNQNRCLVWLPMRDVVLTTIPGDGAIRSRHCGSRRSMFLDFPEGPSVVSRITTVSYD